MSSAGAASLLNDVAAFKAQIEKPAATTTELASNLDQVYAAFDQIDFDAYDVAEHRNAAPQIMASLFDLRMALRSQVAQWHAAGIMSRHAVKRALDCLRAIRYASDIAGELWIGYERLADDAKTYRAFTGPHSNTLVPQHLAAQSRLPFQSGDVILVRGRLHNSAAIARIGDIDSQFSHVLIVYVDQNGQIWAVEALIEDGSVILPLARVLDGDLGRAIVFRHRDPALAQRAAYVIHDRVRHSLSPQGKHIPYDFTMRLDNDPSALFCTKLVRRAYKEASDHKFILPTFGTRLDMKNRDFVERIGVKTVETFSPGEMELEPQFDVVAEWQDYRVTSDLRLQDLVMDKLFEWMERDGFVFSETFKIRLISIFGRLSSYLSNDVKNMIDDIVPKVPSNMKRSAVAAIAMLHQTAQPLLEELRKHEANRIRHRDLPLHPREVRDHLERMRAEAGNEIGYLKVRSG
jgi:hypothetical protein